MFDTMTMTKIVGGLGGTFLVFLLGNMAAESLYHVGSDGHGEGGSQAYVIATEEEPTESTTEEPSFDDALALASAEKGEKVFGKCKACHKLDEGVNGVGPSLYGVVGREIASDGGFGYSDALSGMSGEWTPDALNEFVTSPKTFAPGTKMTFTGIKKLDDRANLVAYLSTIGG